jgi:hypothetical protein
VGGSHIPLTSDFSSEDGDCVFLWDLPRSLNGITIHRASIDNFSSIRPSDLTKNVVCSDDIVKCNAFSVSIYSDAVARNFQCTVCFDPKTKLEVRRNMCLNNLVMMPQWMRANNQSVIHCHVAKPHNLGRVSKGGFKAINEIEV